MVHGCEDGNPSTKVVHSDGLTAVILAIVKYYRRRLSGHVPARCRYDLSCSRYMEVAIIKYGASRGVLMGLDRLLSCHPWSRRAISDAP